MDTFVSIPEENCITEENQETSNDLDQSWLDTSDSFDASLVIRPQENSRISGKEFLQEFSSHVNCRKIEFEFIDTWGDANYLGLTGIEVS